MNRRGEKFTGVQSGAIKNAGEATSLLSKLVAAAAARAAGNCSTAAKIYQAFINALNAQSGKGVDKRAHLPPQLCNHCEDIYAEEMANAGAD